MIFDEIIHEVILMLQMECFCNFIYWKRNNME